jgi:hypothetical protein
MDVRNTNRLAEPTPVAEARRSASRGSCISGIWSHHYFSLVDLPPAQKCQISIELGGEIAMIAVPPPDEFEDDESPPVSISDFFNYDPELLTDIADADIRVRCCGCRHEQSAADLTVVSGPTVVFLCPKCSAHLVTIVDENIAGPSVGHKLGPYKMQNAVDLRYKTVVFPVSCGATNEATDCQGSP